MSGFARQEGELFFGGLLEEIGMRQLGKPHQAPGHDGIAAWQRAVIGFFWPGDQRGVFISI